MVNLPRCAWVRHIPVDKRVAHEKALARKKWQGFPVEKNAVGLARSVDWTDGLASR
jgi:hypothetical protein